MSKQRFPPGWDEELVRKVIAHYEQQTEDEEFAEIEAAQQAENITMVAVPTNLVSQVQELIAHGQQPKKG